MKVLLTSAEARAMDERAEQVLGLPASVCMENAGRGAADVIVARFATQIAAPNAYVVAVGGAGNNGGDAWVVARRLRVAGARVRAVLVGSAATLSEHSAANWRALSHVGVLTTELTVANAASELRAALADASIVIDGFFGTGLSRPLDESWRAIIECINGVDAPLVALDLPSGVDADTGAVRGAASNATLTVAFGGLKRGHAQHPGAAHAGDVVVVDIGAPFDALVGPPPRASMWTYDDLETHLPVRASDSHKGNFGHVLVVGGAPGTTGAATLAALAALRAGAGLATIAASPCSFDAYERKAIDAMVVELPAINGATGGAALLPASIASVCAGKSAAVIGPGLGLDDASAELVHAWLVHAPVPLVVDADALTLLSSMGALSAVPALPAPRTYRAPRVFTPHPGEAARMLGISSADVQADRFAAVEALRVKFGGTVLLKGARTIVCDDARVLVCGEGTPALAVAGSGDVLAGVIAALLKAHTPWLATILGALLHARAGERASGGRDHGALASEIAEALAVRQLALDAGK